MYISQDSLQPFYIVNSNWFSDRICSNFTELYVSRQGSSTPHCGPASHPCLNLTNALVYYHNQTGRRWLACVQIFMDSSQHVDGLDGTGLEGFGDPTLDYGVHSLIQLGLTTQYTKEDPTISLIMDRIQFEHIKFEVQGINLNITDCRLEDSSLAVNEADILDISHLEWSNVTNTSLLQVHNVASLSLQYSPFINANIYFNCSKNPYFKVYGAIDIQNGTHVSMKDVSFVNNYIMVKQVSWCHTSLVHVNNSITMNFDMVTFLLNSFHFNFHVDASMVVAFLYATNVYTTLGNATFRNNIGTAVYGNGCLDIHLSNISSNIGFNNSQLSWTTLEMQCDRNNESVQIIDSVFMNNSGGAVEIRLNDGTGVRVEGSTFTNNFQHDIPGLMLNGGALDIEQRYGEIGKDIFTIIEDTTFHNNSAFNGGAIYCTTNISVSHSNFTMNRASLGAALYVTIGLGPSCPFWDDSLSWLNMANVIFDNNRHHISRGETDDMCEAGRSLYATCFDIFGDTIKVKSSTEPCPYLNETTLGYKLENQGIEFSVHGCDLVLQNMHFDFEIRDLQQQYIDLFHFFPSFNRHMQTYNVAIGCPTGYAPILTCTQGDCQMGGLIVLSFAYGCQLPQPGYYISGRGSYKQKDAKSEVFTNIKPKPCPIPGGNCTMGLRPLDGYWGPLIANNSARFIKCVPEFCCTGSGCIDNTSCNTEMKRKGILCTECMENYSESLFTSQCIPNTECGRLWILGVTAACITLIVMLSVLGILPYFTKYYGLLTLISHELKTRCHYRGNLSLKSENLFITGVVLIFYYTQDVTLYHVDVTPYNSPFLQSFLNIEVIHEIYSLNAAALQAIGTHTCVIKNISPIGKLLLSVSIYPFIFILFGIIYSVLICIRRCISRERADKIAGNLALGFGLVAMLAYQKMTAAALKLVNCVKVHEPVLLIDSNTKCIDTKPVWSYIAICLIPFPFYMMFASIILRNNRLGLPAFLLGLIFPGVYFICLGCVALWTGIVARVRANSSNTLDEEQQALLDK